MGSIDIFKFLECPLIILSIEMPTMNLCNIKRKKRKKISGNTIIEPEAAGREVQIVPLCYAVPYRVLGKH